MSKNTLEAKAAMTVHSFHIFDRRGKTLFTKCYVKKPNAKDAKSREEEEEPGSKETDKVRQGRAGAEHV